MSESDRSAPVPGLAEDGPEQDRPDDTADELEDDVSDGIPGVDSLVNVHSDGDGGVDVASGHASDAVRHGHHGQAEGECGANDPCGGRASHDDRHAASDHGEDHGPDELGHVLSDGFASHVNHWSVLHDINIKTLPPARGNGKEGLGGPPPGRGTAQEVHW